MLWYKLLKMNVIFSLDVVVLAYSSKVVGEYLSDLIQPLVS